MEQQLVARASRPEGTDLPPDQQEVLVRVGEAISLTGTTDNNLVLDEPLSSFFSKGVPVVNFLLVMSFVGKMKYSGVTMLSWSSIMYLTCLMLSFFIHAGMSIRWWNQQVKSRCKIVYLSIVLRLSAAAALLLFLDTVYTVVVLPILLLVLALVAYFFWQTFYIGMMPGMNWGKHKEELNDLFDVSAEVVSIAFGGLNGKVLGNMKGSSNLTAGGAYMAVEVAPECFLFCSVVLALLVVLLTTVPPRMTYRETRRSMAKVFIPSVYNAALLFLVLAGVLAAREILQEYVLYLCFAIGLIALLFFCWQNLYAGNRTVYPEGVLPITNVTEPAENGKLQIANQYLVPGYYTGLFTALMTAAQYKYSMESDSTVTFSWWFKGFVLWAVCSILIYAVRVVVFAQMRSTISRAISTKLWTSATYATILITIGAAFLFVYKRPDELKNFF